MSFSDAESSEPVMTRRLDHSLPSERPASPTVDWSLSLALVVLFLIPRLALLYAREPFFDELFTRWMSAHSYAGILTALRQDSGPPLYYFLIHLAGDPSVFVLRVLSLVAACGMLVLLLTARRLGDARFWAAALLALYPPSVLLSIDARAYALCALLLAVGILALDAGSPLAAAVAFLVAAYCHYYGVLFFPLLLLKGRRGLIATGLAGALFLPGFWLAAQQPAGAMAWSSLRPFMPLTSVSFAGRYASLLLNPPMPLVVVSLLVLIAGLARSWRFASYVLVPVAMVLLFSAFGLAVYFPARFESVLAFPLMLWLSSSLVSWSRPVRFAIAAALLSIGAMVVAGGAAEHLRRPIDGCLAGASFIRDHVTAPTPVVASSYCYLYATSLLGSRVEAFPREQALHPGWWRPMEAAEESAALRGLPRGEFVWLGEAVLPERQLLMRNRSIVGAVQLDDGALLLRVGPIQLH
jgi:hypothetical protein